MIAIIDYGLGNLGSIANMLKKIGAPAIVTADHEVISRADGLVLPGVGAFDHGMQNLQEQGLIPLLIQKVLTEKTPILGLCLGMQLLTRCSQEGHLPGLGWIDAESLRFSFAADGPTLKVPHMGWNSVQICRRHPLFEGFDQAVRFYFVHSYYVACADPGLVIGTSQYGHDFACAIGRENIAGVQFHPEKSHKFGMRLFSNFVQQCQHD